MDIGFIGLGRMGGAMARNLAKAGHRVRAWNRSPASFEGVEIVATPSQAFASEVVFTMLSDDAAIREVLLDPGVLANARLGLVHVVTSTISVAFVDELHALHDRLGIGYVSAPVFGRPDVAAAAQLNIVAAGAEGALAKVMPLLDVVGRKTFVLGIDPKQANAAKVAGNMMIALAIEAMAEATALVGAHGVAAEPFLTMMTQTLFGGRVYENYGAKIVAGDYEPGFRMQLGLKDLRLAAAAGEASGKSLTLLDAVKTQMTRAVDSGLGDKDWSAMAQFTLKD